VDLRCEHTLLGALQLATGWIYHHRRGGGLADIHTWQPFGSVPEAFLTVRAALIDFDFLVVNFVQGICLLLKVFFLTTYSGSLECFQRCLPCPA
jgi:hypothetical protein